MAKRQIAAPARLGAPPRPARTDEREHAAQHDLDRVVHEEQRAPCGAGQQPEARVVQKTIFMTGIPKVSDLREAQKSAQMTSPGGRGLLSILVVGRQYKYRAQEDELETQYNKPVTASAPRRLLSTLVAAKVSQNVVKMMRRSVAWPISDKALRAVEPRPRGAAARLAAE